MGQPKEQGTAKLKKGSENRPTGPGKGHLLVGNALNTPLGQTLRAGILKGRRTSSGLLVGIHDALASVAPFTKRRTEGSRGTKGELETGGTNSQGVIGDQYCED